MRISEVAKATRAACSILQRNGHRVQFIILRAALADLEDTRDQFHWDTLRELLEEIRDASEYKFNPEVMAKIYRALETIKRNEEK